MDNRRWNKNVEVPWSFASSTLTRIQVGLFFFFSEGGDDLRIFFFSGGWMSEKLGKIKKKHP